MYTIIVDTFNDEVEWENKWVKVKAKREKRNVETEIEFLNSGVTVEQTYVDWNTAVECIQNLLNHKPVDCRRGIIKRYKIVR